MSANLYRFASCIALALAGLVIASCSPTATDKRGETGAKSGQENSTLTKAPNDADAGDEEHEHVAGAHGGIIVSLGRDSYHVEAIVTEKGELQLYMLGNDETRVVDIELQALTGYVKSATGTESIPITIKPHAQTGDGSGKASMFIGQLPDPLVGQAVHVTIPNIAIAGERFRLGFTTKAAEHGSDGMPSKVVSAEEKALYLTPGGIYTQADIEANGNLTASQAFKGFQAAHDLNPKTGDKICPVTLTKANPKCSWIVAGKKYEFCCPPCVDEFLTWAKTKPEDVKQPDEYVKQ